MNVTVRQLLERVRTEGQTGLPWPAVVEIVARLVPLLEASDSAVRGHLRSAFVEVDHTGTVSIAARNRSVESTAPEQLHGATGDARTDVYALGLLAWELLTGVQPFQRDDAADAEAAVRALTPSSLALLRTDVPRPAASEIERALKKTPESRPANVRDFAQAIGAGDAARSSPGLGALVRRLYPESVPPPPRPPPAPQPAPQTELISPLEAPSSVREGAAAAGASTSSGASSPASSAEIHVGQPVALEKAESPRGAGIAFGLALVAAAATGLWFLLT